jgi:pyruvate-formate lyase-activating enzyme
MVDILYILSPIVVIGFILFFILLPRYGPHYTSRLICPNCKKTFNFHWVPGATITSIVYRGKRNLKCPYCHIKNNYDIMTTRVTKNKAAKKVEAAKKA